MAIEAEIRSRLERAFPEARIEIHNESHRHAGHAGDDGSGESHWRVVIVAEVFDGMNRLARHRAVHDALGPSLIGRIHALALSLGTS